MKRILIVDKEFSKYEYIINHITINHITALINFFKTIPETIKKLNDNDEYILIIKEGKSFEKYRSIIHRNNVKSIIWLANINIDINKKITILNNRTITQVKQGIIRIIDKIFRKY